MSIKLKQKSYFFPIIGFILGFFGFFVVILSNNTDIIIFGTLISRIGVIMLIISIILFINRYINDN